MSDELKTYKHLSQPPKHALKTIPAGTLKGKTDINPQWRIEAMTETFGLCGIGWKYEVLKRWTTPGPEDTVFAFCEVNLYIRRPDGEWSDPIPGSGGNMLVEKYAKREGLSANDEGHKMATTDALSTAMKMIGVGADIYAGMWDGSKYLRKIEDEKEGEVPVEKMTLKKHGELKKAFTEFFAEGCKDLTKAEMAEWFANWARKIVGRDFDSLDWSQWELADYDRCMESLK